MRVEDSHTPMPRSCPHCAAQMPDSAAFCPGCGRPMLFDLPAHGKAGMLRENLAGTLAYLTFIPAVLFLVRKPYKQNRFVRFHSAQSVLLWVAGVLVAIALKLITMLLFLVPVAGPLMAVLITVLATLAALMTWLVLAVKALLGEMFRFPLLGDLAERYAGASN